MTYKFAIAAATEKDGTGHRASITESMIDQAAKARTATTVDFASATEGRGPQAKGSEMTIERTQEDKDRFEADMVRIVKNCQHDWHAVVATPLQRCRKCGAERISPQK